MSGLIRLEIQAVNYFEIGSSLLMEQMDAARTSSIIPPERFFKRSQVKIKSGHYDFNADIEKQTSANA